MKPLLAWDIDGTLLTSGGAGRTALDRAFEACFGVSNVFAKVDFRGRIDPSLISEAFECAGLPFRTEDASALKQAYLRCLREELHSRRESMTVHPGARAALEYCVGRLTATASAAVVRRVAT